MVNKCGVYFLFCLSIASLHRVVSIKVNVTPKHIYVKEGESAILPCAFQLEPEERLQQIDWYRQRKSEDSSIKIFNLIPVDNLAPKITWYNEFHVIDEMNQSNRASFIGSIISSIATATIHIDNVNSTDEATYTCEVEVFNKTSGSDEYDQGDVNLYFNSISPTIPNVTFNNGETFELFPDDNVTVTCKGNVGYPRGKLYLEQSFGTHELWDHALETSYQIIENKTDRTAIAQTQYSTKLSLADDVRKFRCTVHRESVGLTDIVASRVIQFSVKAPLPVREENLKIVAKNMDNNQHGADYVRGQRVQLTCQAYGYPSPTFKWLKESSEKGINNILHLGIVTLDDKGNYTCEVTNEIRGEIFQASRSIIINVQVDSGGAQTMHGVRTVVTVISMVLTTLMV